MAISTPKTFGIELTTSSQRLMHNVVPAGKVRRFSMIQLASIDAANAALATISWLDASNSNASNALLSQAEVPIKDAIPANVGAMSLEAGDDLVGLASAAGDIRVTVVYWDEDVVA